MLLRLPLQDYLQPHLLYLRPWATRTGRTATRRRAEHPIQPGRPPKLARRRVFGAAARHAPVASVVYRHGSGFPRFLRL